MESHLKKTLTFIATLIWMIFCILIIHNAESVPKTFGILAVLSIGLVITIDLINPPVRTD